MVPQGLGFWSHWIFWLWLCWWSCGPQVNFWHLSFPRMIFGLLVLEETKLRISLHCRSWVHCCWIVLCSITMDEANPQGLWHQREECASTAIMRALSRLLITQFSTRRQSTYRFVIIFFVIMCWRATSPSTTQALKISWPISSISPWMRRDLASCGVS